MAASGGLSAPILRAPVRGLLNWPAVLSHRSGQRVDCLRAHRKHRRAAGLLHRSDRQGRVARPVAGGDAVGQPGHHQCGGGRRPSSRFHQPAPAHAPQIAGVDAIESSVSLPKTFDLRFRFQSSTLQSGAGASTAFGCTTNFKPTGQPPVWVAPVSQILVRYSASTANEHAGSFRGRLLEVGSLHGERQRGDRSDRHRCCCRRRRWIR